MGSRPLQTPPRATSPGDAGIAMPGSPNAPKPGSPNGPKPGSPSVPNATGPVRRDRQVVIEPLAQQRKGSMGERLAMLTMSGQISEEELDIFITLRQSGHRL